MADILLLGPQGAGKGTQGRLIAAEHGIPHVATGDMLRAAMDAGTELGRQVKPIYDAGQLVPDDLMIALIRERLGDEDAREGFVLDGFPRTMPQAEALEEMLREIGRDLDVVFEFQLDDAVGVERMLRRAAEEGRADDTPEAIDERLRLYHLETEPLIEYFRVARQPGGHPRRPARAGGLPRDPADARAGGGPMIIRKAAGEIERMARAGEVVADTLAMLGEHARPGVTTQELDELADEFIRSRGGTPTFKGYRGYPASICASPNEMVVHGIPGLYALRDGDILSVDVGVTLDGFVGDSAYTFAIGEVSEEAERLLEGCQAALAAGIEQCRVGNRLSDISHAIQVATEEQGFSVVRSLVGHGVGRSMHEEPQIPNYGEPGRGPQLAEGMTFAIEPMITAGGPDVVLHDDEWSISSADGSLAAHFEHTVAITADGPADPDRGHERRAHT